MLFMFLGMQIFEGNNDKFSGFCRSKLLGEAEN